MEDDVKHVPRKAHELISCLKVAEQDGSPCIWIFGYGSLIWNPGFRHKVAHRAYLEDYSRKFWQRNANYRGSEKAPGRVVTIHKEPGSRSYGLLFKVVGIRAIVSALEHLYLREIEQGYDFEMVTAKLMDAEDVYIKGFVDPRTNENGAGGEAKKRGTILALTCIAHSHNIDFAGPDSLENIASQIAKAKGHGGPNAEYLLKLAEHTRQHFPAEVDDHLFKLEALVLQEQRYHKTGIPFGAIGG